MTEQNHLAMEILDSNLESFIRLLNLGYAMKLVGKGE
jgi:hypothetical protein